MDADILDPEVSFAPAPTLAETEVPFSEYFLAASGNVLRDSPTSSLYRSLELEAANNQGGARTGFRARTLDAEAATERARDAGVTVDFGTGRYTPEAVDIMIDRARRRAVRDTIIGQYDPSWGTQLGVSLLTSVADPLNIGAAFIPFVGEARYGAMLATAGGLAGRTGVRAGVGAAEGFLGAALVEPLIAEAATAEGRDYQLADAMNNLAFGTVFGAGLHAGGGVIAEKLFKRQYAMEPVQSPADVVQRIPREINEAAFRAAISDMVMGRPVAASDVIDMFMKTDPEAARSISYAATLRRDGPPLDDTTARVEWWKERLEGKPTKPAGEDFMTWVRSKGGVRDPQGQLEADIGGRPDLPPSAYMGPRGVKKTTRGMDLDEMVEAAIAEGFVTNKRQFLDALKAGQRESPLRKLYRIEDERTLKAQDEFRQHMNTLLTDSGVRKNASNIVKARAITGREQHLLAAERARISQAVDKMLKRNEEYKQAADTTKVTPPKPFEPEPIKTQAQAQEPVAVGDMVNIVSGPERIVATPKPVRLERILDDPVYGRWGFIEGSSTGFPIADIVRVGEAAERPKPGAESAAPVQPVTLDEKVYNAGDVIKAIRTALKASENKPVDVNALLKDYLPGLSKNKFNKIMTEVRGANPNLVRRGAGKGPGKKDELFFRPFTEDEKQSHGMGIVENKVNRIRNELDERFPEMAKSGLYYLHSIYNDNVGRMELGPDSFVRWVNDGIRKGKLSLVDEDTGKAMESLKKSRLLDDDSPGILVLFAEPARAPGRSQSPNVGALSEPGPKAEPAGEPATVPPAPQRVVETPPAEREALNTAELDKATSQYQALRQQTERRLNAMLSQLPPEQAASIQAQLAKIDTDAAELEQLYNTAVQCLLRPTQ